MSIFTMGMMALITRSATCASLKYLPMSFGTTCQESPKRSFSQPHCTGLPPPEVSLSQ